jgi:hypothetical protein
MPGVTISAGYGAGGSIVAPEVDRARAQYVRRLYGVSIDDPGLFDLQIDSTDLLLGACADLIVSAYRALDRTRTLISGRNER